MALRFIGDRPKLKYSPQKGLSMQRAFETVDEQLRYELGLLVRDGRGHPPQDEQLCIGHTAGLP